jgi:hypothetical protein
MNKLNPKIAREPTFEISCTLNIPQKTDDKKKNSVVFSPLANYTDRAIAAGQRS